MRSISLAYHKRKKKLPENFMDLKTNRTVDNFKIPNLKVKVKKNKYDYMLGSDTIPETFEEDENSMSEEYSSDELGYSEEAFDENMYEEGEVREEPKIQLGSPEEQK